MAEETTIQGYLRRLRAIPNPSHALRAYIDGVEHYMRLNAEIDSLSGPADDLLERHQNVINANLRRWQALSAADLALARAADVRHEE